MTQQLIVGIVVAPLDENIATPRDNVAPVAAKGDVVEVLPFVSD